LNPLTRRRAVALAIVAVVIGVALLVPAARLTVDDVRLLKGCPAELVEP
jgi:hypothetical protein